MSPSVLVSNFCGEARIFWMMTLSARPALTMPITLSLVKTSWALPRVRDRGPASTARRADHDDEHDPDEARTA